MVQLPVCCEGSVDFKNGAWDKYDLVGGMIGRRPSRHRIPELGRDDPNRIAVCVEYLFGVRLGAEGAGIEDAGVLLLIDRVAASIEQAR
ncbi:MAG: hypothetical protein ACLT1O_04775 [Bifidobacterium pseudocatenulatum]